MEGLDFDNILGGEEIDNLFVKPEESATEEKEKPASSEKEDEGEDSDNDEKTTEAVNPETLFEGEQSESVGSGKEDNKEKEEPESDDDAGASPNDNFYSSIASALTEEGIFPDLDEDSIKGVKTAEDFRDVVQKQIEAGLDEAQKRINKALNNGVEPNDIKKYENTLQYLDSITESGLSEETGNGEQLRRNIIFQDFINRGYTQEKAQKYTDRTIDAGTDIEDAKEALQSNKEYFSSQYNKLLEKAQKDAEKEAEERKSQAEKLKNSMLNDKQLFGDIDMDLATRKRAFDNISKPVYKDPDTGEYYTAIQKYEMEHRSEFLKYAGIVYTLTNGFKDFDSFTRGKVRKEVRKGLKELERTLNNTRRDSGGSLNLVTGVKDDPEAFISKGWKLDL